jgi:hypothetical protein
MNTTTFTATLKIYQRAFWEAGGVEMTWDAQYIYLTLGRNTSAIERTDAALEAAWNEWEDLRDLERQTAERAALAAQLAVA